jgi:hypothetical protein
LKWSRLRECNASLTAARRGDTFESMKAPLRIGLVGYALFALGCGQGPGSYPDAPDDTCGPVRLTYYDAGVTGWCEYGRALPVLPSFVQAGLTAAIAEPWNGGSYAGEAGEACGECWEIDTLGGTETVMITDLCPIEGNPLCAGSRFHLDLSAEANAALGASGLDEGSARRVPCPVEGDMAVQVIDRNDYFLRFAIVNHRIPVRAVEVRGAGAGAPADNPFLEVPRSGGAFQVDGGGMPLARGGAELVFRVTSAQGEVLVSTPIPAAPAIGSTQTLGVQFEDLDPSTGGACDFEAE